MCASAARELLVTLCLRLCAVAASDRRSAGGFWYYPLDGKTFFVVLVTAVYCVMPLQKVTVRLSAKPTQENPQKELKREVRTVVRSSCGM